MLDFLPLFAAGVGIAAGVGVGVGAGTLHGLPLFTGAGGSCAAAAVATTGLLLFITTCTLFNTTGTSQGTLRATGAGTLHGLPLFNITCTLQCTLQGPMVKNLKVKKITSLGS